MDTTNATKKKKGLPIIIIAVIAVIALALFIKSRPEKINLEELVTITVSGYDGYGTAYARLDSDTIYNTYGDKYGEDEFDEKEWEKYYEKMENLSECIDSIELELNKDKEIENGDKLTVKITYDNKKAKKCGLKFKGDKVTLKVKDLEKILEIDPFEDLSVTFTGLAPFATVSYNYTGESNYINNYSFSVDKRENLRNGDKIVISVAMDDEQTIRNGFALEKKEKEYKVSELGAYAESYSDIKGKYLGTLKSEAQDVIMATVASYVSTCKLGELTYSGYVFNSQKAEALNTYANFNNLYIIYGAMLTDSANTFEDAYVYFPVRFSNIYNIDGEFAFESGKEIKGWSNLINTYLGTAGYINPIAGYKELATGYEGFNVEVGDGFEKYNVDGYISSLKDIDSSYKSTLEADAQKVIEEYINTGYAATSLVEDLKLLGEYLLIAKEQGSDYAANNKYILVYSATVSSTENNFPTSTVYFPVEYDGIVKLDKKEFICMAPKGLQGATTYFPGTWYYTNGYLDGTVMFQKLVTANRANYTYEMTGDLKQFGE